MKNPFGFFVELMQQPLWVSVWVFYLMIVNLVSLGYWHESLAKIVFTTFMTSAVLMMILYSRFGFEKILGLGHILWIPLLVYIVMSIPTAETEFQAYLLVLAISIAISLLFDIIDVWKYFLDAKGS